MTGSSGIEIVVRDCPQGRLNTWLNAVTGPITGSRDAGGAAIYATRLGPVIVQPGMGGPSGVGVWFNAIGLPWASDAACARQAARELGCVVLCDPGPDYPEVHPLSPVFLEVGGGGERLVVPDASP